MRFIYTGYFHKEDSVLLCQYSISDEDSDKWQGRSGEDLISFSAFQKIR